MPDDLEQLQKAVTEDRQPWRTSRKLDWLRLLARLSRLAMVLGVLIVLGVAVSAIWPHIDQIKTTANDLLRPKPPTSQPASQPAIAPAVVMGVPGSLPHRSVASQQAAAEAALASPRIYNPGEIFAVGSWEYCVSSVRWEPLLKPAIDKTVWPGPGLRFVVLSLTVCNMGEETALPSPPRLIGPDGTRLEASTKAGDGPAGNEALSPDRHYKRQVVFEVAPGKAYRVLLSGGWMSDRQAVVQIGQ